MSESERDLPPPSARLQALIERERERPGCTPAEQERLGQRIESSLDWMEAQPPPPAAETATRPADPRPVQRRWRLGTAVSLLAAGALGAAAHATYVAMVQHSSPAKPAVSTPAPPPIPMVEPPAPTEAAPPVVAPVPVHPAPQIPAKHRGTSREASGPDRLAEERGLLDIARTALGMRRFPEAQSALEKHQRFYPHGQLSEERESLAVQLLVSVGSIEQARARAVRFHERYPTSIFWPSMQEMLSRATAAGGAH